VAVFCIITKKQEKYSLSIFALKSHSENNSSRNIVDKNKWRYYLTNRVEKYRVEKKHVYLLLLRGD